MRKNKVFAVIDTNVIVSGLLSPNPLSPTKIVLENVINCRIIPLYCDEILEEYHDVLCRDKFHLPQDNVNKIINLIESEGISSPRVVSTEIFPNKKDIVFYEIAMSNEDAYLVTGNIKHFPKKPFVVTPAEMVAILGL